MSDASPSAAPAAKPENAIRGFTVLWRNEVDPGRLDEYLEIVRTMLQHYPRYGIELIGAWGAGLGTKSNEIFLMIDYKDFETYNRIYSDPRFVDAHAAFGAAEMRSNTGVLLNPLDLAPVVFTAM